MGASNKIAIIGSGAVGSYYGARLAEIGHDVHFLVRRDFNAVSSAGLQVTSPDGDFLLHHPKIVRTSTEIGKCDWVICALKATSINEARKLVEPCVGNSTRILVMMNGLGLEDSFADWFGAERIFGGLAFTCINRGKPGFVHHLAYGTITIGHYKDRAAELEQAQSIWVGSRVNIITASSLLRARWEKLCWNIPFSGLCVAAGGITTDHIMENEDLRAAAKTLMSEVILAGNTDLAYHSEHERIDRESIVERMFKNTSTMGAYRPSTMIDFVEGRFMEIAAIFSEPLRRAESFNVPTPYLSLLTALLRSLNHRLKT
jgi:2-dehydropantoate 2-reductase